jgi:type II secretory pathway component PulC
MSLKPDYKDEEVAGYYLEAEGEGEFFKAVGLQEGDTIRKVNSMLMTSQKRAEYFISEFIRNRVNAFVLEVDRNGKEEKLIYLIR